MKRAAGNAQFRRVLYNIFIDICFFFLHVVILLFGVSLTSSLIRTFLVNLSSRDSTAVKGLGNTWFLIFQYEKIEFRNVYVRVTFRRHGWDIIKRLLCYLKEKKNNRAFENGPINWHRQRWAGTAIYYLYRSIGSHLVACLGIFNGRGWSNWIPE